MRLKIRPYLRFLIKQNLAYVFVFVAMVALSFVIVPLFYSQITEAYADIKKYRVETSSLQRKQQVLQSVINENNDDIDQDLALVTALIPDTEDYFSMIYSLEKLSQSTGFIINNYVVNLSKSDSSKLSITVTGEGSSEAFFNLLRTYNFAGGRLITVEQIGIDPATNGGISLNLNFYNKITTLETKDNLNYQESIKELNELRAKVKFSIVKDSAPKEPSGSTDYPTKTSLF